MPVASAALPSAQRKAPATARRRMRRSQARLAGYLAATAGSCGLATTADAEVISIDITAFDGPNGGVASGGINRITDWAGSGTGTLAACNGYTYNGNTYWGLYPEAGLSIAVSSAASASPNNFSLGSLVDSNATFSGLGTYTGFQAVFQFYDSASQTTDTSPDFGANSFIGFRFANGSDFNYGYLEVTWDSATTTWEVLSGAYENQVNTAIAVPEPSLATMAFGALASLCLGGSALKRWKRQRRGELQGDAREPGSTSDLPQTAA